MIVVVHRVYVSLIEEENKVERDEGEHAHGLAAAVRGDDRNLRRGRSVERQRQVTGKCCLTLGRACVIYLYFALLLFFCFIFLLVLLFLSNNFSP